MFGNAPSLSARRRRPVVAASLALVLLLAACGNEEDLGGEVVDDGLGCQVTEVDRSAEAPTIEAGAEVGDATEFETTTEPGDDACAPAADQYLTLDLVGATADDGTVFNDTFGDGTPITVRLGQSQLIAGLETGLASMKVGEQRQITVPAAEAYGADGNEAQGIGADEDLVFMVELVAASDSPKFCNPATNIPAGTRDGKPTEITVPTEPPTDEVVTTVLEEGDGPEATTKSYVTVDYVGVSCGTGQQFDSSWDREEPITAALADAEPTATAFSVIPGWSEGLVGQKQGSLVQIDIPFEQAYGAAGSPPAIGPSDPLTFVVRIVEVSDEAPPDPTATTTTAAEGGETTTTEAAG